MLTPTERENLLMERELEIVRESMDFFDGFMSDKMGGPYAEVLAMERTPKEMAELRETCTLWAVAFVRGMLSSAAIVYADLHYSDKTVERPEAKEAFILKLQHDLRRLITGRADEQTKRAEAAERPQQHHEGGTFRDN